MLERVLLESKKKGSYGSNNQPQQTRQGAF